MVSPFKQFCESSQANVVVTFGRFNPIHLGHEKLLNIIRMFVRDKRADHYVILSHKHDYKNPLNPVEKLRHLQKIFPGINFVLASPSAPSIIQHLKVIGKRYQHLDVIVGSDRVDEFKHLLDKYNDKEYHFDSIDVHSAGNRNKFSNDITGTSGTKMRMYASLGNFAQFSKYLPHNTTAAHKMRLYYAVRKGLNLKEQYDLEFEAFCNEGAGFESGYPIVPDDMDGYPNSRNSENTTNTYWLSRKQIKKNNRPKEILKKPGIIGNTIAPTKNPGIGPEYSSRLASSPGSGTWGSVGATTYSEDIGDSSVAPLFGTSINTSYDPMQTIGQNAIKNLPTEINTTPNKKKKLSDYRNKKK